MHEEQLDHLVRNTDSVIKILFAIMNEEDDIDAYYDKTPEEMSDIIKLVDARYPEKQVASYDPLFTKFGQILLNGYNTFGIDFLKLLSKRTDEIPRFCYKGLIDIYNNTLIGNEELAVLLKKFVDDLSEGNIDQAVELAKNIKEGMHEELSDEEFIEKAKEDEEEFI
jgi:hypothetical protein